MLRKTMFRLTGFLCPFLLVMPGNASTTGSSPSALVFVASTPCSNGTRPLPGIPATTPCELIQWKLQLFKDTETTGTYVLQCRYGLPRQGTKDLMQGGQSLHRKGKWTMVKGTASDPAATICRLDPDKPRETVSLLRLNEEVFHLLDSRQQLMIGNGGYSYTLNRIQ